jgi:predicted nuclease of predicted toxin-antitoxin system
MKFLVDAQLPLKLCEILKSLDIESEHVDSLPKGDESTDIEISNYADKNGLIVITKDSDFYHTHMVLGKPKKLLIILTGNIKNRALFDLIRTNSTTIKNIFEHSNFIELTHDSLISH